jgi:hypothetical protein
VGGCEGREGREGCLGPPIRPGPLVPARCPAWATSEHPSMQPHHPHTCPNHPHPASQPQEVGAPVLFATHFHELTELTGPAGVRNSHVAAVVDPRSGKLTMLYEIRDGPCDQSFGIQV